MSQAGSQLGRIEQLMDASSLRTLIEDVSAGRCTPDDAVRQLRRLPFSDLGFARVDHHRDLRLGIPEAVYGPGKTPEHCAVVVEELLSETDGPVLLTRATETQVKAVTAAAAARGFGQGEVAESGSLSTVVFRPAPSRPGTVVVITAGTADLPVAIECMAVLCALGFEPTQLTDCGVAGLHRLLAELDTLAMADAVVVIAGMEGALASVVGGLTPAPVVAVPTSTGYGAALEGVTALLAMLSACSSGITVVGIDNGYGAACAVARVLP
jgi:pyridinium-3,5-biscarboxylic acid mononucleotide synthase